MSTCPACGAPVDLHSDAEARVAVCGYCDQTLLVERGSLAAAGTSGGLVDVPSPLKPGVEGVLRDVPFYVMGRVRYAWKQGDVTSFEPAEAEGEYEEYQLSMDGAVVWLEQDEGEWFTRGRDAITAPLPADLRAGKKVRINGADWVVTERGAARVLGIAGILDLRVMRGDVFQYFDAIGGGRAISVERMRGNAWLLAGGPVDPSELSIRKEKE